MLFLRMGVRPSGIWAFRCSESAWLAGRRFAFFLKCFTVSEFCRDFKVEEKIISGLLIGIQAERNGQTADTDTLHRIIRMLIAQDTYKDKFEKPFLQVSRQFFVEEGLQMVMETDVAVFLLHVEMRLEQAVSMATHYLSPETLPRLLRVLEEALLQPHIGTLVSRGAPILLEAERVADLRRLFCMCNRVDSLHLLKDSWVNYLR